jgi:RHS repeat-associated protein
MPMDYGFTGQHQDITSGLSYFNARYYDPVAAQVITPDTILPGNGFDIFGLSRYAYVEGNPETRTDPTGRCPWCIGAVVGAVVGAGIAYGTQVVGNLQQNKGLGSFTQVDVKKIGVAALAGLVIGGTGGAAAGWLAASGAGTLATAAGTMGIGAGEGVLGQIGDNLLNGRTWHQDLSQAAVFGAATAGVGGAAGLAAGKAIKRFAGTVVNDGLKAETGLPSTAADGLTLGRAGASGASLQEDLATAQSIADKYGVGLNGVKVEVVGGVDPLDATIQGTTDAAGNIKLYPRPSRMRRHSRVRCTMREPMSGKSALTGCPA